MGEPAQGGERREPGQTGGFRADLPYLAVLVVVAVGLRGWQLLHTEVASRDSIGYIRIAWQLEQRPWPAVMEKADQHPAYPLALLAMSLPVRQFTRLDLASQMQWSAQFASSLASVLLVLPMFYLGRELFDRRIGFWTALFFQCLPTSGRGMADGLSEPLFLLGCAAALAFACHALRRGSVVSFSFAGLFGGLAYLTRPEGLFLPAFTGIVLLLAQAVPRWRHPWRRVLAGGTALTLGTLLLAGPFVCAIGGLTSKHTPGEILKNGGVGAQNIEGRSSVHEPPGSPLWAVWWNEGKAPAAARVWWGFTTFLTVLSKAFFYVYWVPALVGLWWFRDRFRLVPGAWVMALSCATLAYFLYRVAQVMGYLSDRHTLLIVLCGGYFAVAALARLGEGLARLTGVRWGATAVLALAVASPLPRTLETLHFERAGFRTAGAWLAEHTLPGDFVFDPYCWANYYAGRVFTEGLVGLKRQQPPISYLVLEKSANKHTRLPEHIAAEKMAPYGKVAQSWKVPRGKEEAEVVIYQLPIGPPLP
jgi:hypothetical protein